MFTWLAASTGLRYCTRREAEQINKTPVNSSMYAIHMDSDRFSEYKSIAGPRNCIIDKATILAEEIQHVHVGCAWRIIRL
jgi:hypothetical protein